MKPIVLEKEELIIHKNHNEPIILMQNKEQMDIIVEEGIEATLLELFIHPLSSHKKRVILKKGAKLQMVRYQDLQDNLTCSTEFILEESSYIQLINLEVGEAECINQYHSSLNKEHTHIEILGLVKLYDKTNNQSHFDINHHAPHTISNISYKHLLHDYAKALFQATSIVNNDAPHSKAFQNCNTMLLSDDATIFTQPHLEILIDELEASHGATVGGLDEEAMLYLQSRGINKEKAKEMLLKAFENEIYDKIISSRLKTFLKEYKRGYYV